MVEVEWAEETDTQFSDDVSGLQGQELITWASMLSSTIAKCS